MTLMSDTGRECAQHHDLNAIFLEDFTDFFALPPRLYRVGQALCLNDQRCGGGEQTCDHDEVLSRLCRGVKWSL